IAPKLCKLWPCQARGHSKGFKVFGMNTSTSVDSGGVAEGRHTSAAGGVRRTAWRASPGTKTGQLHPGCKRRTADAHGLEGALLWRVNCESGRNQQNYYISLGDRCQ